MRLLYITTIGATMGFFKTLIKELLDDGNVVDIATNEISYEVPKCYREWGCKVYGISCSRSPVDKGNLKAILEIKKIVVDGKYDIIHCHTPIASFCARVACKPLRKDGIRVIYTAHGFHFYSGAPIINWLVYFPIEWICSYWTDVLITINKEDYELSLKHMHAKKLEYIPGVGIDIEKFSNIVVDRKAKRVELGIPEEAYLILSVGELNENKNHEVVIKAIAERNDSSIHYAIAGRGELKSYLENLAKDLGIRPQLHLLGFREDVAELYKIADLFVLPSKREGLNVSLMEARASGIECKTSLIRGNIDIMAATDITVFSKKKINKEIKNVLFNL